MMFLIRKGLKPLPICRECRKLHGAKDCPRGRRRYEPITMRTLRKKAV